MEQNIIIKQFHDYFRSKTSRFSEIGHFLVLQKNTLIHREGLPLSTRDRLYTSESNVCRRQILTYKDGPEKIKNIRAVDP